MNDCIFCKIIRGEIPSDKVYEDENIFAFLDINPVNIGHTLLAPKEHHENIFDLPENVLDKLSSASKKLSLAIKNALNADGVNVTSNNGRAAGQLIDHAHIHIIPRYENDGFKHWKGAGGYQEGEAKITAEKIKSNL